LKRSALFVFALMFFSQPLFAAHWCEFLLKTDKPSSQKFLERIGALSRRYEWDKKTLNLVRLISAVDVHSQDRTLIKTSALSFSLRKKLDQGVLTYIIPAVNLVNEEHDLNAGKRPSGLNTDFARLSVALLSSIEQEVTDFPQITTVHIEATSVVNQGLIALFKASGFHRQIPAMASQSFQRRVFDQDFGPRSHWRWDPQLDLMARDPFIQVQADGDLLKTWNLSLRVERSP